jgi:hypothetical protein
MSLKFRKGHITTGEDEIDLFMDHEEAVEIIEDEAVGFILASDEAIIIVQLRPTLLYRLYLLREWHEDTCTENGLNYQQPRNNVYTEKGIVLIRPALWPLLCRNKEQ